MARSVSASSSAAVAAAIEFSDVSLRMQDGRLLLEGISLSLAPGSITAMLGRSGSGKTTLLRMVNRLAVPTGGMVRVHGEELRREGVIALRRGIGYVIQETGLFPHLTIARNVMMVPELASRKAAKDTEHADELLKSVGLDPAQFSQRYPHQLSGGQRQRVGLARALAGDPAILLMDEPFGALDPLTRAEMQDMLGGLLGRLKDEDRAKTVLLVTHDLDEAMYLADRIVLIEAGRLVGDLTPQQFLAAESGPVAEYVRAFHRGERAVVTREAEAQ